MSDLGDLLAALARLSPQDDAARKTIAAMLGIGWTAGREVAPSVQAVVAEIRSLQSDAEGSRPQPPALQPQTEAIDQPDFGEDAPRLTLLGKKDAVNLTNPGWYQNADVLPKPAEDQKTGKPLPMEPLISRNQARGTLAEVLGTLVPGEIDLDRAIEDAARGQAILQLPRSLEKATHGRLDLLLDCGPSMLPFQEDHRLLVEAVRALVPQSEVRVHYFDRTPLDGVSQKIGGRRRSWPFAGELRPCLTASDLGMGPYLEMRDRWIEVAEAGVPMVVLLPYPEASWPPYVRERFLAIEWDRTLTASSARRAVARFRERNRG